MIQDPHMAWALNIPSITIFGNTPAYRNAYETKINKSVESSSVVNPFKLDKRFFNQDDWWKYYYRYGKGAFKCTEKLKIILDSFI